MKRLIIAIVLIAWSAIGFGQQFTPVRGLNVRDSMFINGFWIKKITGNLNTSDSNHNFIIPTAKAVADFIRTKTMGGPGGGTPSGGTTNIQLNYSNSFASTSRFRYDSVLHNLYIGRDYTSDPVFLGEDVSSYNIVVGKGNIGSNFMKRSLIVGDANEVNNPFFGGNIVLLGDHNFTDGGSEKYALGDFNNMYGNYSYAFGYGNNVGVFGLTFGLNNLSVDNGSVAGQSMIGNGLISNTAGWSLITGRFNDTTGSAAQKLSGSWPVLQVGNGSDASNRSNAFSLLYDGRFVTPRYKNNPTEDSIFIPDQNGFWKGILKSSIGQNYIAGNGLTLAGNQFRLGNLLQNTSLSGNFSFLRAHKSYRITAQDSLELLTTACSGCYIRMNSSGKTEIGSSNQIALSGNVLVTNGGLDMGINTAAGLPRLASDPVSSFDGMVYYNTASNTFRKRENGVWGNWSDGSGVVSSFNSRTGAVVPATNDYTWAQINKSTSNLADIATRNFADLQSKPTTIAGYGITDPIVVTSGSYPNPSWLSSLAWSKITGTPTTFAGYGLTVPVSSVSVGNLSPLFTSNVATATTTPAITYSLSNAPAGTLFGNITGSAAAPGYNTLADIANALPAQDLRIGGSIKKTISYFGGDSLHLDGDVVAPGNSKYYGTNASGTLGYFDLPAGGGGGDVTSVFGRTGVVVAATNDYTWSQINKSTSSLADITTRSASDINSGTLADGRLSSNVPLKNASNTFSADQIVNNAKFIVQGGTGALQINDQSGNLITQFARNNGDFTMVSQQPDVSFRTTLTIKATAPANSLYLDASGRLGLGTTSPGAYLQTPASTTSIASLRLPHGSAPSSPVNGDIWTTTSGVFARVNSSTVQLDGGGSSDHGALTGLGDDDHTQYALLLGRSGGQSIIGGTAAGNDLTLASTSNGTKGNIFFGNSTYDEVNDRLGIGTTSPGSRLDIVTNSLGVTPATSSGLSLLNNTAAAAGAQQISPMLRLGGNGWKTNATASSQAVEWQIYNLPIQDAANPRTQLMFAAAYGGTVTSQPRIALVSNNASSSFTGFEIQHATGGTPYGSLVVNGNTGEVKMGATASSYFPTFYSNNAEVARFNTSGSFGIATNNPQAKLHVVGSVRMQDANIELGTSANKSSLIDMNSSGNIELSSDATVQIDAPNGNISLFGGLLMSFQIGTDAATSMTVGQSGLILPQITANRGMSFPTGTMGKIIYVINENTSGFAWTPNVSFQDKDGSTITTFANSTNYMLRYTGSVWKVILKY